MMPEVLKKIAALLPALENDYIEIEFIDPDSPDEIQLGYRVNSMNGQDITGIGDGEWHPDWYVIAYDAGNPFFVNISEADKAFPVYTAEHGAATWQPEEVCLSVDGFAKTLMLIDKISSDGPIPMNEMMKKIAQYTSFPDFWRDFIEGVNDALEDSGDDFSR